ncbi:hypothetical protein [Bremerella cremea]|uniref:hypothetical protein n=1 Tax=Bremerella cremea TaxID=1031537 RepID=UPI0031E7CE60
MNLFARLSLVCCLIAVPLMVGCGSEEVYDSSKDDVISSIQSILVDVEKTGQKGSAYEALSGEIERLREFDASLADTLKADLEKMEAATKPAELKTLASEAKAKL